MNNNWEQLIISQCNQHVMDQAASFQYSLPSRGAHSCPTLCDVIFFFCISVECFLSSVDMQKDGLVIFPEHDLYPPFILTYNFLSDLYYTLACPFGYKKWLSLKHDSNATIDCPQVLVHKGNKIRTLGTVSVKAEGGSHQYVFFFYITRKYSRIYFPCHWISFEMKPSVNIVPGWSCLEFEFFQNSYQICILDAILGLHKFQNSEFSFEFRNVYMFQQICLKIDSLVQC